MRCLTAFRRMLGATICLLIVVPVLAAPAAPRPNILVIMAEDMSSRVGAFGDAVAVTPNIDRLAAQGTRYTNTFTTSGVCAPSRAAHITGMHANSIGAQHMRSGSFDGQRYLAVPPPLVKAYPELLRRSGYYTFTTGKLDYQFSGPGAGSGPFTIWDDERRDADWRGRASDQPFYGLVTLFITHESQLFDKNIERNRKRGVKQVARPETVRVPAYYPDTPPVRGAIAQQYDNIHFMDAQVGELLARLEADNLADNTIVIWTTDHGDGLPRAKRELYDSGVKVPMIIYWPEQLRPESFAVGEVDERLISFIDFAPSILQLAGIRIPAHLQGLPTLFDKTVKRSHVFGAKDRMDEMPFRERMVRDARYKLIVNDRSGEPGAKHLAYREQMTAMQNLWQQFGAGMLNAQQASWFRPRPARELYDTNADPDEVNNLADQPAYAGVVENLEQVLEVRLAEISDRREQPEAALAAQFWPGGKQPITGPPTISTVEPNAVRLACPDEGASIGYRLGDGRWQAYATGSLIRVPGATTLHAKAVRYGWQESQPVSRQF